MRIIRRSQVIRIRIRRSNRIQIVFTRNVQIDPLRTTLLRRRDRAIPHIGQILDNPLPRGRALVVPSRERGDEDRGRVDRAHVGHELDEVGGEFGERDVGGRLLVVVPELDGHVGGGGGARGGRVGEHPGPVAAGAEADRCGAVVAEVLAGGAVVEGGVEEAVAPACGG